MSPKLQPVRGTHDILPEEFDKFNAIINLARELGKLYGFDEMATPIFEMTEVFLRSMGETSDVVSKEMFTFETKGEESVTLRPEFTAGIVRAFIFNGMQQHLPLKLFSTGPLFRYERPQKGRQRQFHQVNFEWLGDDSPEADIEIIQLAGQLLFYLSGKKGCKLLINTLGDKDSRERYRDALVSYLTPYKQELSEDSRKRLVLNPLRILDSKNDADRKIIETSPKIANYLSGDAKKRFDYVCETLSQTSSRHLQDIKIEPSLVRGLDYYTDTVFEFVAETGELGAQNTVLAGGRYDGLIEQMGGKPTSAIGFAAGIERLVLLAQGNNSDVWEQTRGIKIFVMPVDDDEIEIEKSVVHNIASVVRFTLHDMLLKQRSKLFCSVQTMWQGKLAKRMEKAAKQDATHVIILPTEEMKRRACIIQNMDTRERKEIQVDELSDPIKLAAFLDLTNMDPGLRRDDGSNS
jgi:histidyl-tRNA synthetase